MADLKGFSKTAQAVKETQAEARASGQRAKRREPGEAPSGYDQDIWTLAIRFQRYALTEKPSIILAADLPVIHDVLDELVTRWDMRKKSRSGLYVQEVSGCARRELSKHLADRCWYHWPPRKPAAQEQLRVLTWVEVVEILMAELWSRVMDEYALDHFRQHFAEYGLAMANHWKSLRIIREINAQPKDHPRPIVRRRVPSGTTAPPASTRAITGKSGMTWKVTSGTIAGDSKEG
jgi:hypothetical protein